MPVGLVVTSTDHISSDRTARSPGRGWRGSMIAGTDAFDGSLNAATGSQGFFEGDLPE